MKLKAIPVTARNARRRVDDTVTLTFDTNFEVSDTDFMEMDSMRKQSGWLLFSANEEEIDIPKENAPRQDGKSPSKKLRDVMFLYWKQKAIETTFEQWYENMINKQIEGYKERLDD